MSYPARAEGLVNMININSAFLGIILRQKVSQRHKNICLEGIQNGSKSKINRGSVIKFLVVEKYQTCEKIPKSM